MKKKVFTWLGKFILACVFSGIIVSGFSFFYYNPPVHIPSDSGITDYRREPGEYWSRGMEGFTSGRMDENGYNNLTADVEPVDILFMGSSQTEGLYVKTEESYPYLLVEELKEAGLDLKGYNIGMSSHTIFKNISNLPAALETYHPRYLVLEDISLNISKEAVEKTLNHELAKLTAYSAKNLRYWVQKNPYVKLIYSQYNNFKKQENREARQGSDKTESLDGADLLLTYLKGLEEEYGCRILILHIPDIVLDAEKQQVCEINDPQKEFEQLCISHDIAFYNPGPAFNKEFQDQYIVPSGFSNTAVAYGHLNRYGHRTIADGLSGVIQTMEKEGER